MTVTNIIAYNKIYNGNTQAFITSHDAILNGTLFNDSVAVNPNGYTANFAQANVGNNIPVTVSNLGLTGSAADNYTLIQPTGLAANILPPPNPPSPGTFGISAGTILPTNYSESPVDAAEINYNLNQLLNNSNKPFNIKTKTVIGKCVAVAGGIYICESPLKTNDINKLLTLKTP